MSNSMNWVEKLDSSTRKKIFKYVGAENMENNYNNQEPKEFVELVMSVKNWGEMKGIVDHQSQFMKTVEELGELSSAILKQDKQKEIDSFGDVLVCLIILMNIRKLTLHECLQAAYEEISKRKGAVNSEGSFIKEE